MSSKHLIANLRDLSSAKAPASLQRGVLARLGLADEYLALKTPLGRVFVAYNRQGISAVAKATSAAAFEAGYRQSFKRSIRSSPRPPQRLLEALAADLEGHQARDLRFDLRRLSLFERQVLLKAREIPRGEVRPYAWIAREIGHPKAVRAVGSALAKNPIPLFIPCHRVVRSDGRIGNYSLGGSSAKRTILGAEGVNAALLETLASSRQRFWGRGTTRIFCFPTCRHARRLSDKHRVTFRTELEAKTAGYRPCKVCRPALAS